MNRSSKVGRNRKENFASEFILPAQRLTQHYDLEFFPTNMM